MMQFAQMFPDFQIVSPLVTKLSWTHFLIVMPLKEELQREFYLTMAAAERWSKRTLQEKIDGRLYERTVISSKPDELIKNELAQLRDDNVISPDLVFKSPYFLEFTGLKGMYSEKSLEDILLAHLEQFIIELGNGFSFVARQKRMRYDDVDFYIDLVFYHSILKCHVLVDLKLGKLTHEDVGQMDSYIRMFDALHKNPDDNPTLGIILCSQKSEAIVKYSVLNDGKQIFASRYKLYLPTEEEFKKMLENI